MLVTLLSIDPPVKEAANTVIDLVNDDLEVSFDTWPNVTANMPWIYNVLPEILSENIA